MDAGSLENALNKVKEESLSDANVDVPKMSEDEEKGFHKGALNTLVAERNELAKMVGNVEAIMKAHIGRLKELGVDIKNG